MYHHIPLENTMAMFTFFAYDQNLILKFISGLDEEITKISYFLVQLSSSETRIFKAKSFAHLLSKMFYGQTRLA